MFSPFCEASGASRVSSLRRIAERLFFYLDSSQNKIFDLNGVSQLLGVTKRRLYDILNVVQPLGLVSRMSSGTYRWQSINPSLSLVSRNGDSCNVRLVSQQFLAYIRRSQSDSIMIEELIQNLPDGKKSGLRRVYDVIAIYEALNLIERKPRSGSITVLPMLRNIFRASLIPLKKRNYVMINSNNPQIQALQIANKANVI